MRKQYHILNGDSLKEQFPENIQGEIIVAKECLVDGSVKGNNLTDFFKTRAKFISSNYDGYNEQDYFEKTVPEFQKMQNIPENTDINLWFEDDLFCQVNLWFVANLIYENHKNQPVFLIRPKTNYEYNFGGMNKEELLTEFRNKIKIELSELKELSKLWKLYQQDDCDEMIRIAEKLKDRFPFLIYATKANKDRLPQNGNLGRPTQTLIQILDELNTVEFGPIFKEFNRRQGIYGFGDLQVKRILDEINNNR
tara:strand:- start:284 stop:1039 length:756 start_codon:yes stop_codon:yes gene_type:complete